MQISLAGRVSRSCRRRYGKGRKWNLIYIPRIRDANERHGAINFDLMGRAETFGETQKGFPPAAFVFRLDFFIKTIFFLIKHSEHGYESLQDDSSSPILTSSSSLIYL